MTVSRKPTHRGACCARTCCCHGMTVSEMARRLRVSRQSCIGYWPKNNPSPQPRRLSWATARNQPGQLLNMQRAVDLWHESHRLADELAKIEHVAA